MQCVCNKLVIVGGSQEYDYIYNSILHLLHFEAVSVLIVSVLMFVSTCQGSQIKSGQYHFSLNENEFVHKNINSHPQNGQRKNKQTDEWIKTLNVTIFSHRVSGSWKIFSWNVKT